MYYMESKKVVLRGEAALAIAIFINSMGVLLMLQSGSGISAISSVPYAFSEVLPVLTKEGLYHHICSVL